MATEPLSADTKVGNFNEKEPPDGGKPVSNRSRSHDSQTNDASDQDVHSAVSTGQGFEEGHRGAHSGVNARQQAEGAGTPESAASRPTGTRQ